MSGKEDTDDYAGRQTDVYKRQILDGGGAEKLLGRGDMLFYPVGMPKPVRIQGCFVSDKEVEQIVQFVKHKDCLLYTSDLSLSALFNGRD